ncbi:MAG TPA: histidine phosphatase family protein [Acidimicrobiia bacterium]|nr:histidine phosphatase family protein [Acidimicrobiia bacterium]
MKLLLIRHAEPDTEHGPRPDPPLSALGRAQGRVLAAWLAGEPLAGVYTSPLLRARETAGFLSPAAVALDGLAEIGGTGEYVAADVLKRNGDPRYAALISGDLAIYGTDVATFRAAVVEAIDGIVDRHAGDTVAVVSHAGVINAYLGVHLGIEKRLIWSALGYASVTRVVANREGARTISALNELPHHCGQPANGRPANGQTAEWSAPWPVGS